MNATIQMKLKPFQVPNYAVIEMPPRPKQEGVRELPPVPVADLAPDALRELAQQWLTELYRKAGKTPDWAFFPPPEAKP